MDTECTLTNASDNKNIGYKSITTTALIKVNFMVTRILDPWYRGSSLSVNSAAAERVPTP